MAEPYRASTPLATGTVTFLLTDIEGSTALWEQDGARMSQALAAHDLLARSAVESHHGVVVKMTGDGVHAVFDDARQALAATLDMQRALTDPAATCGVALRVRCGLHAGMVERRDNDYFGSTVNRAARIMSAAHGGQVLLSQAVIDGVREILPAAVSLRDLGKVRLKDLSTPEHVYQVVHPQLRQEFPALRSLEATPNNLPQQATSFIGRDQALEELQRLLVRTRLLTLTGSGGCGKTRLSLQLAADALEQFPDGAWFAELAPLSDPGLVPQTVATVLGLMEEAGKPISQTLTEHLKDKRLLLLLDNCEHLLDVCAKLADALLRQCPGVQLLASSREALGIGGEQSYRVPSLSLPDPKQAHTPLSVAPFEAVQLFTERALLARPDFQVTPQNAATLAAICYRLDGIPLAIELAAARVRLLSVEEINHKLDQRFRLLTGGSRTALPRQQTLRSLIDWSYNLLHDPEQLLLQRLSAFAGGWTLAAAEQVCAGEGVEDWAALDLLTSLADKSLLVVEQSDEHSRYRLLETVRQYARERLLESGGGEAVRVRHRDYFLMLAEEVEPKLLAAEQAEWLRRLDEEHENLRSALEWSLAEAESGAGLRLCGALYRFWWARGYLAEGRKWCARILAKEGAAQRTLECAKVLMTAGNLAWHQTDYPAARALGEESLAISRECGDREGTAQSLNNLGNAAVEQGDYPAARALYEESLAIRREMGDRRGVASVLGNLGNVAYERGDFTAARALSKEALAILRELGDRGRIADALNNLGNVAYDQGDLASARALNEESLAISRELCDRDGIASSLHSLGGVAYLQGDLASARALYKESLANRRELGDRLGIARALEGLAAVAAALGSSLRAARIWGAAQRLREEIGTPLSPTERSRYDQRGAAARAAVGDDAAFDRAWQEGHALTLKQAIELASEETAERP
jgi:predicted ATPase/class 3 adenylate cyclase/Tfp pilus assembly protein PilF